jgi:hypothetical protein
MNDEMLQRFAEEISKQTIINSWPYYLALIALSFLAATFGAYLRGHLGKRGEVAATKADAKQIMHQLSENIRTTKSVELSLGKKDWIERERNSLKRLKLEKLVIAGFSISSWAFSAIGEAARNGDWKRVEEFSEFEMLSILYFPELLDECKAFALSFGDTLQHLGNFRAGLEPIQLRWDLAMTENDFEKAERARLDRKAYVENNMSVVHEKAAELYQAAHRLADAAHKLMEQLTATPSYN